MWLWEGGAGIFAVQNKTNNDMAKKNFEIIEFFCTVHMINLLPCSFFYKIDFLFSASSRRHQIAAS